MRIGAAAGVVGDRLLTVEARVVVWSGKHKPQGRDANAGARCTELYRIGGQSAVDQSRLQGRERERRSKLHDEVCSRGTKRIRLHGATDRGEVQATAVRDS